MLESLIKPKDELVTVTEDSSLADALTIFNSTTFRAIPILDTTGTLFRGAIYKMHIFKHQANQGDLNLPVTTMMRNMTKFIETDATFFDTIFALQDLPFISVVDANHHFQGILTHTTMLKMLANSWQTTEGRYVLTLLTDGARGSLERVAKYISRYSTISSALTLNPNDNLRTQRLIITLPNTVDKNTLSKIIKLLSRKGFHLESLEDLEKKSFMPQ
ncbi:CBS domain-containing protein [Weissella diestrammenae]|uniref:CBS domain-containing protein n=1 Tax=Weissella diestrammenae TaxID=1162633 RepID=A0A7G9T7D6_9LACO|nr:cyclic di-AMP binding protein CbpA [Weissella diestrammenae]MCM0582024.1 CBS domain-containing protein [Weissella diestrammenae]QNN76011.1 CBS domain-containing protein [Weissella diestrammenae]